MSNWIEEAENKHQPQENKKLSRDKIEKKIESIRKNYEQHKETYDSFVKELRTLVDRVNNLPIEHRKEFGKLKLNAKKSKLQNELYYITSSRRVKKRVYRGLFSLLRKSHFKNVRVAYFTVSRKMGMMNTELKENLLLKVRMSTHGNNDKALTMKQKDWGRLNELYLLKMEILNNDLAMEIIDWVSFRTEMDDMSFKSEKTR